MLGACDRVFEFSFQLTSTLSVMTVSDQGDSDLLNFAENSA